MSRRFPSPAYLPTLAAAALLSGCVAGSDPSTSGVAAEGGVRGYWYHDTYHPNDVIGQPSPQAIHNATHGTWLWPPSSASGRSK
jgi:hypothetical protein